ncbi:MAG: flavodoxin family protein, partial [Subdoligranulum variabile]|nr:flavodoxin family protein [Subdoligranulum variabile]
MIKSNFINNIMRMHSAVKEVPMSKKVLILSGSPRKGGNSDILCDEFLRGAQDAGHKAEKIRVAEKKVAPCSGCYYCS